MHTHLVCLNSALLPGNKHATRFLPSAGLPASGTVLGYNTWVCPSVGRGLSPSQHGLNKDQYVPIRGGEVGMPAVPHTVDFL